MESGIFSNFEYEDGGLLKNSITEIISLYYVWDEVQESPGEIIYASESNWVSVVELMDNLTAGLASVDAANCYDSVAHAIASLVSANGSRL